MSYIDGNLLPGEQVVYRTRLHWLLFMTPVLFTVIVLLPIAWWLANGTWSHYAWIPVAIGLLILLATYIKRQSSDFAVTNKRVMMKVGVFSTRSIELVLNKVEAIAVNQSLSNLWLWRHHRHRQRRHQGGVLAYPGAAGVSSCGAVGNGYTLKSFANCYACRRKFPARIVPGGPQGLRQTSPTLRAPRARTAA